MTEQWISLPDNVKLRMIRFEPAGVPKQRPSVIFVAGWVSRIEGWRDVLIEMSRDFIVYYIETREKISSKVPKSSRFDIYAIGEDIVQTVKTLGLKQGNYLLFGSSLGATVILDCYARLSVKPCGLILIAPNAEFRMPWIWKVTVICFFPPFYLFLKPWIKWYLKKFRLNVKNDREQYEKYCRALDGADPFKLKPAALAFSRYQVWPILKSVDCPVLIVGGSLDKLHEPENLRRMVSELTKAEYLDLGTNAGTHTAQVVVEMRRFIGAEITFKKQKACV